jgi:hypothetical protein
MGKEVRSVPVKVTDRDCSNMMDNWKVLRRPPLRVLSHPLPLERETKPRGVLPPGGSPLAGELA